MPQPIVAANHLCASIVTESASSRPANKPRYRSEAISAPPQAASTWHPDDPRLRELHRGECRTDNLSPWPGVARAGERLDHDEFMRRPVGAAADRRRRLCTIGEIYLNRVRRVNDAARAASIASYEDGGLSRVFSAMLRAPDWNGAPQQASASSLNSTSNSTPTTLAATAVSAVTWCRATISCRCGRRSGKSSRRRCRSCRIRSALSEPVRQHTKNSPAERRMHRPRRGRAAPPLPRAAETARRPPRRACGGVSRLAWSGAGRLDGTHRRDRVTLFSHVAEPISVEARRARATARSNSAPISAAGNSCSSPTLRCRSARSRKASSSAVARSLK